MRTVSEREKTEGFIKQASHWGTVGLIWEQARSGWSLSESFLRAQRDHKNRRVVSLPLLRLVAYMVCVCVRVCTQSCPTLCDPMDCSPSGSSVYGIVQARQLVKVKVAQACLTLCDPMDYTAHGILQARILEWVALPSPGDLPDPGIKPGSPALQVDSLSTELWGKPTGIGCHFLLQEIFLT